MPSKPLFPRHRMAEFLREETLKPKTFCETPILPDGVVLVDPATIQGIVPFKGWTFSNLDPDDLSQFDDPYEIDTDRLDG